jgi:hypothetical protein
MIDSWIPALATLAGVGITLFFTNRREAKRLKHEREMKLREERLKAYATFARVTKNIDASEPYQTKDLAEAHSTIELLTDNSELQQATEQLWVAALRWRKVASHHYEKGVENPYAQPDTEHARDSVDQRRNEFLRLAKEDLELETTQ